MKIAVTFSTLSGNTALVANDLVDYLNNNGHKAELFDVINTNPDQLKEHELVFLVALRMGMET